MYKTPSIVISMHALLSVSKQASLKITNLTPKQVLEKPTNCRLDFCSQQLPGHCSRRSKILQCEFNRPPSRLTIAWLVWYKEHCSIFQSIATYLLLKLKRVRKHSSLTQASSALCFTSPLKPANISTNNGLTGPNLTNRKLTPPLQVPRCTSFVAAPPCKGTNSQMCAAVVPS